MNHSLIDLADVRETIKRQPKNYFALRQAACHYLKEGSYRQAQDYYLRAVQTCPHIVGEVLLDYEREINRKKDKIGPRLSLAGLAIQLGNIDEAVLEFEEALEVNPKNIEVYNALGKIYLKQERLDETITLLERSLAEGVKDLSLTEILAGAYLEKGKIKEAIKFYEELLVYRSNDKQVLRILGDLYAREEDYCKAAKCYEAMFSDDPEVSREVIQRLEELLKKLEGNVFIREVLADVYMRCLNPEASVKKLNEIIRLDIEKLDDVIVKLKGILKNYPNHPEAVLVLGEALRMKGSYSEAAESYHDLAKTNPNYLEKVIEGYREVLRYCAEQVLARTYLAEALLYKNQVKEALSEFDNILRYDSSTADAIIKRCRDIIKSQPQLLLAHLVLGRAYMAKDDLQRAVLEAEGVLSIDKKSAAAYLLLGEAYTKMKLNSKAVTVLKEALSMDTFNLQIQQKYQEAEERELDQKIDKLKERIATDNWKISLHLDLAKLYVQKGVRDEAVRELQVALREQARAPFALNLLGTIYRGEGRFDLAAAQFNQALELASAELTDFIRTVRFNLGTTYEGQGNINKAIKIYEKILQEDLDFGDLKQHLKYLKASSLQSVKTKNLLAVFAKLGSTEVVAMWGRESKPGKAGKKEEINLSFGHKYNSSGFEYFMKGMYKAAIEELQLAVQLDARFASALNNLGVALLKEGRIPEAKEKFAEAVHLAPNSVVFHNNLGVAFFLLGRLEAAKKELEKAYTLDPELKGVSLNFGDLCYLIKDARRAIDLYKRVGHFDLLSDLANQRLVYKVPTS